MLLQGPAAPDASWTAARVASDLALSKDLMLKLDAEKGIEQNALASPAKLIPAEAGTMSPASPALHSVIVPAWIPLAPFLCSSSNPLLKRILY